MPLATCRTDQCTQTEKPTMKVVASRIQATWFWERIRPCSCQPRPLQTAKLLPTRTKRVLYTLDEVDRHG
ncbi:hypothetical protein VUR80DRAFT_8497 [Thermomyces stellatus]